MTDSPGSGVGRSNLTIPNVLTIIRILLTPGFVVAFINQRVDMAWILFAVAGLTDALDGFLARVLRQRSILGAILDPLADKMLLDTSYVCLALAGWLPAWVAVLVVTRDVIIVGGATLMHFMGMEVSGNITPSWTSKATTASQILLILYVMLEKSLAFQQPLVVQALVGAVAGLTIASGTQYVIKGLQLLPTGDNGK